MRITRWVLATAAWSVASAAGAATIDCARDRTLQIGLPVTVEITGAERVAAAPPGTVRPSASRPPIPIALPTYCKVSGVINRRTGSDGKTYGLRFELALPDDWNGRLLFQGGGGTNGVINPPLGAQATGARPALTRGFAVISTDGGHASERGFDSSFNKDQQAALDFAQDSVGTTTIVAKLVVAAHYGRPPHHSYIVGCSTGGREAMLAAQRYPDLFDGVVAGAPAMRTGFSNITTNYITVTLNKASVPDAEGHPTALFSHADKTLILDAMLEDCDALDGLKDGVIAKFGACHFKPARIACKGEKTASCLSRMQVQALETAFLPPRDASGAVIYPAFPWDTGVIAEGPRIPGILTTAVPSPLGPPNLAMTIDLDQRARTVRADGAQMLADASIWTNLSTFLDHGGKIIWYHGTSDPWFSPLDTQDFFERAARTNGARWKASARLYFVPGAGHCGGGDNTFDEFDLLAPIVDWVERGTAPAGIPAHRNLPTAADRPLCPWPGYPRYRGNGDVARLENFECRSDSW